MTTPASTPRQGPYAVDHRLVTSVFVDTAGAFCAVVAAAAGRPLDGPGLGQWTLRDLVGHATRAFTTTSEHLTDAPAPDARSAVAPDGTDLGDDADPVGACGAYFLFTTGRPDLSRDVAERGRQAGRTLGDDVAATVDALAGAACAAVQGAPQGAVFATRFGVIAYATYLCSRVTELVVHGFDIADAAGVEFRPPAEAERLVLAVMAESARRAGVTPAVIRALGGRAGLPDGLSVFG